MNHREYFNDIAPCWDNNMLDENKLNPLIERLDFSPNEIILDGGTGTGNLIPFLKKIIDKNSKIFAVDFAPEMTKRAFERFGNEHLFFMTADVENQPFRTGFFTTIIYFSLFPHIKDKQKALVEVNRLLLPGGRFIIAHLMSREQMNDFHKNLNGIVKHDELPDKNEMFRLLRNAHLNNIELIDEDSFYFIQAFK